MVHDQVPDLVGNIETLSIVVVLHRIQHDDWARASMQRVCIDRLDTRFAKHDDHTSALCQPDEVLDRSRCDAEEVPGFTRHFLR